MGGTPALKRFDVKASEKRRAVQGSPFFCTIQQLRLLGSLTLYCRQNCQWNAENTGALNGSGVFDCKDGLHPQRGRAIFVT